MQVEQRSGHSRILHYRLWEEGDRSHPPGELRCRLLQQRGLGIEHAISPATRQGGCACVHLAWIDENNSAGWGQMGSAAILEAINAPLDDAQREALMAVRREAVRHIRRAKQLQIAQVGGAPERGALWR